MENFNPLILNSLILSIVLILCDTLMGILVSLKNKSFNFSELPKFLSTAILPYIGSLLILAIFSNYISDMMPVFLTCVGLVGLKFSKEMIIDKVKELFK